MQLSDLKKEINQLPLKPNRQDHANINAAVL